MNKDVEDLIDFVRASWAMSDQCPPMRYKILPSKCGHVNKNCGLCIEQWLDGIKERNK